MIQGVQWVEANDLEFRSWNLRASVVDVTSCFFLSRIMAIEASCLATHNSAIHNST